MSPGGTKPFESPVRTPGWMTQKQPFPLTQMKSPPSVCTQNITGPPGGQSEHGGEFKENTALLQSLDLFSPLRSFEETNTREEEGVWGRGGIIFQTHHELSENPFTLPLTPKSHTPGRCVPRLPPRQALLLLRTPVLHTLSKRFSFSQLLQVPPFENQFRVPGL